MLAGQRPDSEAIARAYRSAEPQFARSEQRGGVCPLAGVATASPLERPFATCHRRIDSKGANLTMNILPSDGELTLAGDFPAADDALWRALVAKVLNGADFERRLVRETDDGIAVQPLYTALPVTSGLPGAAPFVRGAAAAAAWDIRQRHGHGDPTLVNAQ